LDFLLDALFVLADDDFVLDLLVDLTLDALTLADLVLPAFDLDIFLLPSTSASIEAPEFLLPFLD
jgi:hypothetical protein